MVRDLRRALFDLHPELISDGGPELARYAKNMCSVLALLGYRADKLRAVPELAQAVAKHIKGEFLQIFELGISASKAPLCAHLWSYPELQHLVKRAHELFDTGDGKRSNAKMMVVAVLRGSYPDIETLHSYYRETQAEALRVFGADEETASVAGSAVSLVINKDRASIAECHAAYVKALRVGENIAKRHKMFQPLVRTMAGFVMAGRFNDSMHAAFRVYRGLHREVEGLFADVPGVAELVRTTVLLRIKGTYKTTQAAFEAFQKIHTEMDACVAKDPELANVSRSLELAVFSKSYKSVDQVVERYRESLALAEVFFEKEENGRSFARTATDLVIQKRYKSIAAAHDRYQMLMQEISASPDAEGVEVSKTLVLAAWKGSHKSIVSARKTYLAALADCESKFGEKDGVAGSAALLILRGRFEDAADARRHYAICLRKAEAGLSSNPLTEPFIVLFASNLFVGKISSIAEAKARYLEIHADCQRHFGSNPDSADVVRTAAQLVFRGTYLDAATAHIAYLKYLEEVRTERGHRKNADGQDEPGIRTAAMRRFETRSESPAREN